MTFATGYGPGNANQKSLRLLFDRDEKSYELWETRFLADMELRGLRKVILKHPQIPAQEIEALAQDELKKRRICGAGALS